MRHLLASIVACLPLVVPIALEGASGPEDYVTWVLTDLKCESVPVKVGEPKKYRVTQPTVNRVQELMRDNKGIRDEGSDDVTRYMTAAMNALKFEQMPLNANPGQQQANIVRTAFKVSPATVQHLQKLIQDKKTIVVGGDGSIKIE